MIGIDHIVINLVTSVVENVVGLHHPKTYLSLYCGFQVVADDDDVSDRKIRV